MTREPPVNATGSLIDPNILECPYEHYRALQHAPLHFDAGAGFYVCTQYEMMRDILRNTDVFKSRMSQTTDGMRAPPPEVVALRRSLQPVVDTLVTNDPPGHQRVRAMMDNPFRARNVQRLSDSIRDIVNETIDSFIHRGECDFVHDFAIPVPIKVIADQLGIPRDLAPKIKAWSDAAVEPLGMMVSDQRLIECTLLQKEFQDYFVAQLEERRAAPRDDLLSHLVTIRDADGNGFSMSEMLSLTSQLLVAGNETTTNAIAEGMKLLVDRPEVLAALRADPTRTRTFAEETLRLESPVQGLFRVVAKDTELAGHQLKKGARIMLRFAAANRDEQRFPQAEQLDLRRPNAATHLAFGAGIHHCIGATLAREEIIQSFAILPVRLQELRYATGKNDFRHHPSMILRGLKHLYIEFATPKATSSHHSNLR